jgi:hypothetical protein
VVHSFQSGCNPLSFFHMDKCSTVLRICNKYFIYSCNLTYLL